MSVTSLKEVLEWTQDLHQQISALYSESAETASDPRTQMLLQCIASQEKQLAAAIKLYETELPLQTLNPWMNEYLESNPLIKSIQDTFMASHPLSPDNVIQATVTTHQQLIEIYKDLAKSADCSNLEEIFQKLVKLETHEMLNVMQNGPLWSKP